MQISLQFPSRSCQLRFIVQIQDLEKGTTLKDKATISAQEGGKESSNYVGIPDAAVIDRLTEGLPPREYQELAENSSAREEWDAMESEKEVSAMYKQLCYPNLFLSTISYFSIEFSG